MKKFAAFAMSVVFVLLSGSGVDTFALGDDALLDDAILRDAVANIYAGPANGSAFINSLRFTDMDGHWAAEAVVRTGAMGLVNGFDGEFFPQDNVTREEALAFALRAAGLESESIDAGAQAQAGLPLDSPVRDLWSLGYLAHARDMDLITAQEYRDAITEDQAQVADSGGFLRADAATREEVANWLSRALSDNNPDELIGTGEIQGPVTILDWNGVDIAKQKGVEAMTKSGVMKGDGTGYFRPKDGMTRAEMAQTLKALGKIYYDLAGLEQKDGTIGAIRDNQYSGTNASSGWRNIYVRTEDGGVDVLQYQINQSNLMQDRDAPVYSGGEVLGMEGLEVGDAVQYIVRTAGDAANGGNAGNAGNAAAAGTEDVKDPMSEMNPDSLEESAGSQNAGNGTAAEPMDVIYIQKTKGMEKKTFSGKLFQINTEERTVVLTGDDSKKYVFSYMEGLVEDSGSGVMSIKLDKENWQPVSSMPYGSSFEVTLNNNIVVGLRHLGEVELIPEVRGIVTENDVDYGVLTIYDDSGEKRHFNYYENDLTVEKRTHYDTDDEIGYLDEVFPNFEYDPMDTVISAVETGDIVFIRTPEDQPGVISKISAATNYSMKYARVSRVEHGTDSSSLIVEFEDKRTAQYDAPESVFVTKDGRPAGITAVMPGDWVKMLVNQAVIEPGYMIESLKEITVEGAGHEVSNIIKGNLSSFDTIQGKIVLENAYTLTNSGWDNHQNLQQFSLPSKDIEYYNNDQRISPDYADRYLKRGGATVYVALQENFGGEAVAKVTFRNERDQVLPADNVINTSGTGAFTVMGNNGAIETDAGTIVRRHGRLVDGGSIIAPDYATVVLNGQGKAAVVDIKDEPSTDKLSFARGIIQSVDVGQTFKLQSMALLYGDKFVYTPIQREYDIDHNTIFLTEDGVATESDFMNLGETSPADAVYNIVADGSHADFVAASPYARYSVRGVIQSFDGEAYTLSDAYYYDNQYGRWNKVSNTNSMIVVNMLSNTLIGKNNQIVTADKLSAGDQIRVLTGALPDKVPVGSEIDAVIALVEK